jgi:hypothetical protein
MALTDGNKTFSNATPASNSATLAHNQDVGSDGLLLAVVTMTNTVNFTSASYGGDPMTLILNQNFGGLSQRQCAFFIKNPKTGSNNFVINFSGQQWNPTSVSLISFLGSSGVGNNGVNGASATPNSQNLSVSNGSMIYATGISINAQSFGYIIDGSTRTNLFSHNTNRQVEAAISAQGLASGSKNVQTLANFGNITNVRIEIQEASSPVGVAEGNWLLLL